MLRLSSQRIIEQNGLFFGDFAWRYNRGLAVNDADLHHPLKASYHEKEAALMTEKLRENP